MPGKETACYSNHLGIELYEGTLRTHKFPSHYHFNYTIVVVEEGEMIYHFLDEIITIRQGEALIINPLDAHYNQPAKEGCTYKAIFLPTSIFTGGDDSLLFFARKCTDDKFQTLKLLEYFGRIQQLVDPSSKEWLLVEMSSWLVDQFPSTTGTPVYDPRILPVLQFIDTHLDDKLTISQLAKLSFMSPYHFQRVFKSSIGLTVKAYIQQRKTEHGKQLLKDGQRATSAAYETGYFDQGHFHKAFKKMWVVNPSHFS